MGSKGRVHLDSSAFRYLHEAADVINAFSDAVAEQRANVEAKLAAPNLFVGREGEALASSLLHGDVNIPSALVDVEATALDLALVCQAGDNACRNIRNTDEVASALFDLDAEMPSGKPWDLDPGLGQPA
jgi:hypothetical protein